MALTPPPAYAARRGDLRPTGATGGTHSTHDALVDGLDQELRALVRAEGVDPQRDADVVRRLAEGVVRRHDDRSLTGVVAPLADPDAMVGELLARVSGFGPLQPLLDDPSVEEFVRNHDLCKSNGACAVRGKSGKCLALYEVVRISVGSPL